MYTIDIPIAEEYHLDDDFQDYDVTAMIYVGHGFIGCPKGQNVERALGFSLTGTVSTSPNLAKARARRVSNDCRATRSLFS